MRALATIILLLLTASSAPSAAAEAFDWKLPPWVRPPPVPAGNPMNPAKVELGRRLFYDIRLSGPGYMACATCHIQSNGFAERRQVSLGITGDRHSRNAPGLANVGYFRQLTWADHRQTSLETQLLRPLFGKDPVEMGASGHENAILNHVAANSVYRRLFREAFGEETPPIDFPHIAKAIAAFQRTLISRTAPYDLYRYGGRQTAISHSARRGETLFMSERLKCGHCHAPPFFGGEAGPDAFHNTGLYNEDGEGGLPGGELGLAGQSGRPADLGRFRTPSLRNVAVTAPYMHDGSLADLDAVIDHYRAGGQATANGAPSPRRSAMIAGFRLTPGERSDLLAFLESLTDRKFLTDPRFATPFQ
jgi:cytochrome c peroxidase